MSDDFTFQIKADPSQALEAEVKVTVGLQTIEAKAKDAGKAIGDAMDDAAGHMTDLIALAAGFVSAHALEGLVDGFTEISNKLRVVSADQDNLNGLMTATLAVAQDTRTSWDDIASTYQRLSNVTRALGLSQQDVLDLEKEIAEAGKVSGASSRETGMAMAELTHAFTTGAVQGREFRVLMRDVPQLMHELQAASGLTGSKFAEMGKHGQITAQLLIDWFHKADASISEKFAQTIPTIGDQLTKLHNAAENFFGSTATGTGVMRALTDAMQFVIEHFETFGKALIGAGEAIVGLYVIEKVIGLVKLLTAAIAANPIGALVVAATVAIGVLRQFGDQIDIDAGGVAKLSDFFEVLWEKIRQLAATVVDFVENAWGKLTSAFSDGLDSTGIELSLRNVLLFMASFADAAIGIFTFIGDSIVTIFGGIPVMLGQALQSVINQFLDAYYKVKDIASGNEVKRLGADLEASNRFAAQMSTLSAKAHDAAKADVMSKGYGDTASFMSNAPGSEQFDAKYKQLMDQYKQQIQQQVYAEQGVSALGHGSVQIVNAAGDSAADFLQKFKDDWQKDIKGTTVVKDMVAGFMDEVDKHAADRARSAKPASAGTVSTTRGAVEAREPTDKELAALRKLENELRAILEQSNPVVAAQEKLAHAQVILNQAVGAGLISWSQAETAMTNYRAKLQDQLEPFDAMVRKLIEQTSALRSTAVEQSQATEMERLANEAKKAGIELTDVQVRQLDHLVKNLEDQKKLKAEEHALYDQIQGPIDKYALTLRALDELYKKDKIDAVAYALAVDQARLALLRASQEGNTVTGGLERGWLVIKQQVLDVGTAVEQTLVKAFDDVNKALLQVITTGSTDWSKMIDGMLSDLTKLFLQIEEKKLIESITGSASGAASGAAAGTVIAAAITTSGAAAGVEMGTAIVAAGAAAGAEMAAAIVAASAAGGAAQGLTAGGIASMMTFAGGGSFRVGGTGGTDSQVVAFRASPNERVTITTPEQDGTSPAARSRGGGSGRPVINVHNHYDRNELLSVLDTPDGHASVVNVLRKNPGALRSILQR